MRGRAGVGVLVVINGAPGVGKSTVAGLVAEQRPLALALDIDALKHSLGGWRTDARAAGLQARRLAVAVIERHLQDGYDVVVGQYLARPDFLLELESLARVCGARWVEVLLELDPASLAARIEARHRSPDRAEHLVNNEFVKPDDAFALVESMAGLRRKRPHAVGVDAARPATEVARTIGHLLGA